MEIVNGRKWRFGERKKANGVLQTEAHGNLHSEAGGASDVEQKSI